MPLPPSPPPRWLVPLVETTLHRALAGLPRDEAAEVNAHAASFVAAQLDALPWSLRLAFAGGAAAFFGSVRVATLRSFAELEPERRVRLLEAWSHGPVPATRQLFRVLRSTALLAAGEHPLVARRLEPG